MEQRLIAANALLEAMKHRGRPAYMLVQEAPTIEARPVAHGRWIASHDEFCTCSICKYPVYAVWNQTNYCPNCGAKMDLE